MNTIIGNEVQRLKTLKAELCIKLFDFTRSVGETQMIEMRVRLIDQKIKNLEK